MMEEEWLACADPVQMLRFSQHEASERQLRLLAVAAARLLWSQIPSEPLHEAVEMAERYADGYLEAAALQQYRNHLYRHWKNNHVFAAVLATTFPSNRRPTVTAGGTWQVTVTYLGQALAPYVRDVLEGTFCSRCRPVTFNPAWRTDTSLSLARQMYESRDFGAMPILADAIQDAGCEDEQILHHCRDANQPHVRGCWVVDLVLEKS
jgi:hypothetical protein